MMVDIHRVNEEALPPGVKKPIKSQSVMVISMLESNQESGAVEIQCYGTGPTSIFIDAAADHIIKHIDELMEEVLSRLLLEGE